MKKKPLLLSILLSVLSANTHASIDDLDELRLDKNAGDWQLIKHDTRHDIKAYKRRDDRNRGISSLKVEGNVNASLETVARVYFDIPNYTRWYATVIEAKLLKKVSDTEFYFYLVHNAPVALPNRDAAIKATITPYTAQRGYASYTLKAEPSYIPIKSPLIRVPIEDMEIRLIPLSKDKTRIELEGMVDPGGVVPAWAVNAVQRSGPYTSMLGIQRMVLLPQYNSATTPLPFKVRE